MNKAAKFVLSVALATAALGLVGWGAPGHRTITQVAIALLPDDMPAWLRDPAMVDAAAYQSGEPDRYRGISSPVLSHENNPDHYLDAELLARHALTLKSLPHLRYEYVEKLIKTPSGATADGKLADGSPDPAAGAEEKASPNGAFNPEGVGMLPYSIAEHYAKLVCSFNTVRILERLSEPRRAVQLATAKANVIFEMGQLSHFVGDAGQPLHLTIHHHGWVGPNPKGYTTERKFHAHIDEGVIEKHHLGVEALIASKPTMTAIAPGLSWDATIGLLERTSSRVEPLYQLQKSGDLAKEPGKAFIATCMGDASGVLSGLYHAAWVESEPSQKQIDDFVKYNMFGE